jgi:hypothetical protein
MKLVCEKLARQLSDKPKSYLYRGKICNKPPERRVGSHLHDDVDLTGRKARCLSQQTDAPPPWTIYYIISMKLHSVERNTDA